MKFDIKWVALVALVVQNSGLAVMMRFTFMYGSHASRYTPSTAVLIAEVMKFVVSMIACFVYDASGSYEKFASTLKAELLGSRADWMKLMVPSLLYTLQNSLQYFSMSLLSAPVFQVLYQMKIITTAVFSVALLSKRIGAYQWLSVISLAIGVALVQLSQLGDQSNDTKSNSIVGLISVVCGCITSGFAGVYFEMVLKSSQTSIWLRNIQLSLIGGLFSLMACYFKDSDIILDKGFLFGYDKYVWGVIILQAVGGLIVAVVVKYADNLLKGFATSLSILLSCAVSANLFNDVLFNSAFMIGCVVVLCSVFAYGYTPPAASNINTKSLPT